MEAIIKDILQKKFFSVFPKYEFHNAWSCMDLSSFHFKPLEKKIGAMKKSMQKKRNGEDYFTFWHEK